eukprot:gnl/TRDRNA2_/TRDRNA2_152678_c0_seq6.p1 gnl/TRDRNA2_/TRDRNA2_152678_c0~~gnl/TRDRNA2_/TRDRNA2_152678_c0_seq6.p1  ORF type:complete len:433 (+),score=66.76 gnl/TRDRNA2_/TRDRNA2_152678_c0_seq6:58-1356(+)
MDPCYPSVPLWLHNCHGLDASALAPCQLERQSGVSLAEAFAAAQGMEIPCDEIRGLPGQLEGQLLRISDASNFVHIPLRMCEISSAGFPTAFCPHMSVIVVVPPLNEMGLQGTIVAGAESAGQHVWYMFTDGSMHILEVMEHFGMAGCVRDDLKVYAQCTDGVIGEGSYAQVFGMQCWDSSQVAVKRMNHPLDIPALHREVSLLLHVQPHKYIICFRGIFWDGTVEPPTLDFVFDMAPNKDIFNKVVGSGIMEEDMARPIFCGILLGLEHIHSFNIIHRDIKAENILLLQDYTPVITDFGLATELTDEEQMARRCGSLGYVAPEVCLGTAYGAKVDIFGAGVVLYFMVSKELPFISNKDRAATMRKTVKCVLHLHRPPFGEKTSRFRSLVRQLLAKAEEERPSAHEALEHSWFSGDVGGPELLEMAEPPDEG